ncbi:MAG: hypothetical protein DRI36_06040 [Caldiserica bacterium]|nr:MAG: hypothetical protein DRI36_06040 [Caldisericota bacterium]
MLTLIGYLINSILAIIFILLILHFITLKTGKRSEEIPAGLIARDIAEIVNSKTKKIIPQENEANLTLTSIIIVVILFFIVKAIFL